MDELVNRIRQRAAEALLQMYYQESPPGIDPMLELIGFLWEDEAGSLSSPADSSLTANDWLTWNELVTDQQTVLLQTMTRLLERERMELPAIIHQARFQAHEPIVADSGVLFTTYTMLSTDFDGARERFKQLTDWLGPEFDGVIAFDEAHLMKNAAATPHGGKATLDHGTLPGNMGITLQRLFPNARVRYFSATGATVARHMAPYERLGLWGVGAPCVFCGVTSRGLFWGQRNLIKQEPVTA